VSPKNCKSLQNARLAHVLAKKEKTNTSKSKSSTRKMYLRQEPLWLPQILRTQKNWRVVFSFALPRQGSPSTQIVSPRRDHSRRVISVVSCCHNVKLFARALRPAHCYTSSVSEIPVRLLLPRATGTRRSFKPAILSVLHREFHKSLINVPKNRNLYS